MDTRKVGVLGGGQLGRMLIEAANRLNIQVNVLDAPAAPAKQISAHDGHVSGSFKDAEAIRQLAKTCDVLTVEIEHVDTAVLAEIEQAGTVAIEPRASTLRIIKDKFAQKQHLAAHGVAVAESVDVEAYINGSNPNPNSNSNSSNSNNDSPSTDPSSSSSRTTALTTALTAIGRQLSYPYMLKSKTDAYDGRGNFAIATESDIPAAIAALGPRPLYAERWAPFTHELAVMVVRTTAAAAAAASASPAAEVLAFPAAETVHEASICKLVYAPPRRGVSAAVCARAQALARRAVAAFEGKGVFGVEMFLLPAGAGAGEGEREEEGEGRLLVNEIAPRPHNSGHYTIEACAMSQYEAHLRAILDLPVPEAGLRLREPAVMLNLLGGCAKDSHLVVARRALGVGGVAVHLYGKGEARPGRKMGHLVVTAPSIEEAERIMQPLVEAVDEQAGKKLESKTPAAGAGAGAAGAGATAAAAAAAVEQPLVAVVMGSDSDMPILRPCFEILDKFKIPYQARITSAHRTPDWMRTFAKDAKQNGFRVIIAAAGGAAHLPGMAASWTVLPVIGVPVKASVLDGVDSLYSMSQMPRGEPVATVGINNSTNAALLAARILGVADARVATLLREYAERSEAEVRAKDASLLRMGPLAYLKQMGR